MDVKILRFIISFIFASLIGVASGYVGFSITLLVTYYFLLNSPWLEFILINQTNKVDEQKALFLSISSVFLSSLLYTYTSLSIVYKLLLLIVMLVFMAYAYSKKG